MPIKPENKKRYPADWKAISADIRVNRAKNRCEVCGIKNHIVIQRLRYGKWRQISGQEWDMVHSRIRNCHSSMRESLKYHGFVRIVLTVGHLDHTPENNDPSNLKAMCQYCHNRHDVMHRAGTRKMGKIGENQIFINF